MSGAIDGMVRLWRVQAGGALTPTPSLDLFDLDSSAKTVALHSGDQETTGHRASYLAAAGSEKGTVVIWNIIHQAAQSGELVAPLVGRRLTSFAVSMSLR